MDINPKANVPVLRCVFARHDEIKSWKFGKKFLTFIESQYPQLFPEFAHYYEPVNVPVPEEESVEHMRPYWEADGSMWARRKKIRSFGHWFNRAIPQFPDGMLKFLWTIQYDPKLNIVDLIDDTNKLFKPDFACVAMRTKAEKTSLNWTIIFTERMPV